MHARERIVYNAIKDLVDCPDKDLLVGGVTASSIKTMKDMLEWKQMALYAEEHEQQRDKSND